MKKIELTTIQEIKNAVDEGKIVHSSNDGYIVRKTKLGNYTITFVYNGYCIGLHGLEGTKYENQLNGKDFYYYEDIQGTEYEDRVMNSEYYKWSNE